MLLQRVVVVLLVLGVYCAIAVDTNCKENGNCTVDGKEVFKTFNTLLLMSSVLISFDGK